MKTAGEAKLFLTSIYLDGQRAVKSLKDHSPVTTPEGFPVPPVTLARRFEEKGADGIILFDLSVTEEKHQEALDAIRSVCEAVRIPVTGAGRIKRMEDVKKLLYAGCDMAALNYSKKENIELTREVADKFGAERIAACYRATDAITENEELIRSSVSRLILIDEAMIKEALDLIDLPTVIMMPDISLDKLLDFFRSPKVVGIAGGAVNDNADALKQLKELCEENGIVMMRPEAVIPWEEFKKDLMGLVPVVVQEDSTDEVLMVAYMNREAYETTIRTGKMTYYSRSRHALWVKGETSGHFQYVKSLTADCDTDTILARVEQIGPACHTGAHSCFFRKDISFGESAPKIKNTLEKVYDVIQDRRSHPKEGSYTNYLFEKGLDKMLKKLGEESTEIVIAAKNEDKREIVYEMADYLYHLMVVMAEKEITWQEISDELDRREQKK